MNINYPLLVLVTVFALSLTVNSAAIASDHHNEEQQHIEISLVNATKAGIVNAIAHSEKIKQVAIVYGRVVNRADGQSVVLARFDGLITSFNVNIGDTVKAGDTLVQVESSDSLKRYNITAPISGVVTQRFANPGEVTNQRQLLLIENTTKLWADFKIFPHLKPEIARGQDVTVASARFHTSSRITHLMANSNQPFSIARVPLTNINDQWNVGQILSGSVVTSEIDVELAIDNRALQQIEGKTVVFVSNQGGYEMRHVELGQRDVKFSQIISGLKLGEQYALSNSYLLKADLGKAGASHAH